MYLFSSFLSTFYKKRNLFTFPPRIFRKKKKSVIFQYCKASLNFLDNPLIDF